MLFVLSKIFNFITSPLNWLLALLLLTIFTTKKKWKRIFGITSVVLFFIFTNNQLATLALQAWSAPYRSFSTLADSCEIAFIAGGSIAYNAQWQQVDYSEAADRVTEAIRLYRTGMVKTLYFSGESAFNIKKGVTFAPQFLTYMAEMGVPAEAIVLEQHARTTAENAKNLRNILPAESEGKPILLITSGWHMRRTLHAFKGSGLHLIPYPVDVPALEKPFLWQDYLPTWNATRSWQKLFHEWLGMLVS